MTTVHTPSSPTAFPQAILESTQAPDALIQAPEVLDRSREVLGKIVAVFKAGGSSLARDEQLETLARQIELRVQRGEKVVIVVSARGKSTDQRIEALRRLNPKMTTDDPLIAQAVTLKENESAIDLAVQCRAIGLQATVLAAEDMLQARGSYDAARVVSVRGDAILDKLSTNDVAICAGFQGVNERGERVALGRGGSDLTAVALAAELNRLRSSLGIANTSTIPCVFLKDNPGIAVIDPRVIKNPKIIGRLTYEEALMLTEYGYEFLMARCISVARAFGVQLEFRDGSHADQPVGDNATNGGTVVASRRNFADLEGVDHHSQTLVGVRGDTRGVHKANEKKSLIHLNVAAGTSENSASSSLSITRAHELRQLVHELGITIPDIAFDASRGMTFPVESQDDAARLNAAISEKFPNMRLVERGPLVRFTIINEEIGPETEVSLKILQALASADLQPVSLTSSHTMFHLVCDLKDTDAVANVLADTFDLRAQV